MASKKLKKFLAAGVAAYAGSKMLGQKKQMSEYLKTEGGDKSVMSGIAKKKGFKEKVMDAVNVYRKKGLNTGPGPNATSKMGGTLAGDYSGLGLGDMDGAKKGKFFELEGDYKGKSLPGMAKELIKTAAKQHVRAGKKIVKAIKNQKGKNKNFGLESMDGARYGKMINASNGVMVESRGNKLARSKPTKIC